MACGRSERDAAGQSQPVWVQVESVKLNENDIALKLNSIEMPKVRSTGAGWGTGASNGNWRAERNLEKCVIRKGGSDNGLVGLDQQAWSSIQSASALSSRVPKPTFGLRRISNLLKCQEIEREGLRSPN